MSEIRCIAPAQEPRFKGDRCNWFVTRPWIGVRLKLVGIVGHSDLADPNNGVWACPRCGMIHEVAVEVMEKRLETAA